MTKTIGKLSTSLLTGTWAVNSYITFNSVEGLPEFKEYTTRNIDHLVEVAVVHIDAIEKNKEDINNLFKAQIVQQEDTWKHLEEQAYMTNRVYEYARDQLVRLDINQMNTYKLLMLICLCLWSQYPEDLILHSYIGNCILFFVWTTCWFYSMKIFQPKRLKL